MCVSVFEMLKRLLNIGYQTCPKLLENDEEKLKTTGLNLLSDQTSYTARKKIK